VRRLFRELLTGVIAIASWRSADGAIPTKPAIGHTVQGFAARDVLGANFSLSQIGSDKIVVIACLGIDCPLARLYAPRLVQIANKYQSKGIALLGIDANRQDGVVEIAAFARSLGISFPILKDVRQALADQLGVIRTPQVVVLDRQRRIRYRGRIDDQFGFVPSNRAASYHKTKPARNDLESAIEELLAGKPVSVPETEAAGCLIGRDRRPEPHSAVTYTKDVAQILNRHCVVCHRPKQIAPFALTSYEEAIGWADMIAEVTELDRMPPWHADPKYGSFRNDARLDDKEKRVLAQWAASGAPEGNQGDLPTPPMFADGWTISEPDEIIYLSPEPCNVPATGVLPYQRFVVDPGWKEDRWISAMEAKAGNPAVVHHITCLIIPPGGDERDVREDRSYLGGYAPGMQPAALPAGFGRLVPVGSKLLFKVHYTPNGSPQQDRSYVGFKFADPRALVHEVTISAALNSTFKIPAGASNYEVQAKYVFESDSLLLSLGPHMHYRGKDFSFEALYPDGSRETLLSVPRYDFGWQHFYRLKEPKVIPQGTVLKCMAHYDNTAANPNNPDPSVAVGWGDQIFEEMMVGFLEIAPAAEGIHRTRWWDGLASRFSAEEIAAATLTGVNVILIGALIFGSIRFRRRSRTQGASSSGSPGL
jgi:peroxiredoxin